MGSAAGSSGAVAGGGGSGARCRGEGRPGKEAAQSVDRLRVGVIPLGASAVCGGGSDH